MTNGGEMTAEPYFGGLPTAPQVNKLKEKYADIASMRGKIISHAEVESVIGEKRTANRYKTITGAWRRLVERENGVVISGRTNGEGFRVLADSEQVTFGVGERKAAGRKVRRWYSSIASVDPGKLTGIERAVRDRELVSAGRIHLAMMEVRKTPAAIAPPVQRPQAVQA